MKKSLGFYIVNVFAFLMMLAGFGMIVAEGYAHYHPFFTKKPAGAVLVSAWTATPFIVGGVLTVFGALILGYTVVRPALLELEGLSPFIAQLLNSVKLGGTRATDVQATQIVAAAKSDPDKDKP
jgi:hypothetical protein